MVKSSKPAKDTKNRSKLSDQVKASIKTREFSKSHQKRMKKKEKQQLNVDLNELDQGLLDVSQETTQEEPVAANSAQDKQQQQRKKLEEAANKTSNKPLTQKQKQKALQLESKRLPQILNHPQYSKDPFGTLKQHAQNMLNQRADVDKTQKQKQNPSNQDETMMQE